MLELNGTIIAFILNFIILVWILNHFLYKPVQNMLLERKNIIETSLQDADRKQQEAVVLRTKYDQQLHDAHNEAQNIVKNALSSAEKIKYEAFESAKKDAEFIREQAEKEAREIRIEARCAAKGDLSSLICAAAGKIIKKDIDEKSNKAIIDEMIGSLDKVKMN